MLETTTFINNIENVHLQQTSSNIFDLFHFSHLNQWGRFIHEAIKYLHGAGENKCQHLTEHLKCFQARTFYLKRTTKNRNFNVD